MEICHVYTFFYLQRFVVYTIVKINKFWSQEDKFVRGKMSSGSYWKNTMLSVSTLAFFIIKKILSRPKLIWCIVQDAWKKILNQKILRTGPEPFCKVVFPPKIGFRVEIFIACSFTNFRTIVLTDKTNTFSNSTHQQISFKL